MLVLGITGPTGAGKTTVLQKIEELSGKIIDCDRVYHELLENSAEMLQELRNRFGSAIFGENGVLHRKELGAIVFADPAALEDLNRITHRFVCEEADRLIAQAREAGYALCALDAIALLESGLGDRCDCTIAVLAPEEDRVRRIMARDGISEAYARHRVAAQKPGEWFAQRCTYTLRNDGTREMFAKAAEALLMAVLNKEDTNGREVSGAAAAGSTAVSEQERLGCDRQQSGEAHRPVR